MRERGRSSARAYCRCFLSWEPRQPLVQPPSNTESNGCPLQRVRIGGLGRFRLVLGIGSVGVANIGAAGAANSQRALDDPRLLAQDVEAGTPVARPHDSVETILHIPGGD